jgi:Mn2+/Fe2+ NRAMP family transporter
MAGAAIGVSHLMQSTRAGAAFRFQLVGLVIAVNVAKYPFFEFGHRWAIASGTSLLDGYLAMGRWYLHLFLALNLVTAVISIAGVTFVTAALAETVFGLGQSGTVWSAILMGLCIALLLVGHYRWLDRVMKIIMAVLFVTTVTALVAAVSHGGVAPEGYQPESPWQLVHLGFLLALMGWMPAPIELSVWQSLWVGAKEDSDGRRMTWREAHLDFNFGYALTTVLAVVFLALGALVMHGSGETFATGNVAFASQLVGLYASTLGAWVQPIVAAAALTAMLSTTLTVIDAYPRSLAVAQRLALGRHRTGIGALHGIWMVACSAAALVLITAFLGRFTALIDLATILAFLAAPIFAWLNLRLLTSEHTPEAHRPGPAMRALAWSGMLFFLGFGVLYLVGRLLALA